MFSQSPFTKSPFEKPINLTEYIPTDIESKPKLNAPTISIIQDQEDDENIQITITSVPNALKYRIYSNGIMIIETSNLTSSYKFDKNGNYQIYAKAFGDNVIYAPSDKSNLINIEVANLGNFLMSGGKYLLANLKRILLKLT